MVKGDGGLMLDDLHNIMKTEQGECCDLKICNFFLLCFGGGVLVVVVFVCLFLSHSKIYHLFGEVIIIGEGLEFLPSILGTHSY